MIMIMNEDLIINWVYINMTIYLYCLVMNILIEYYDKFIMLII